MILSYGDGNRSNITILSPSIKILEKEKSVQNTLRKAYRKKRPSKRKYVHHTLHTALQPQFHNRAPSAIPAPPSSSGKRKPTAPTRTQDITMSVLSGYKSVGKVLPSLNQELPKMYTESRKWLGVTTPTDWQTHSHSVLFCTDMIVMKRSQSWTNTGDMTECKAVGVRYSQLDDSYSICMIYSTS